MQYKTKTCDTECRSEVVVTKVLNKKVSFFSASFRIKLNFKVRNTYYKVKGLMIYTAYCTAKSFVGENFCELPKNGFSPLQFPEIVGTNNVWVWQVAIPTITCDRKMTNEI